jgi:ADP-ribosylation factor-like protein 8
MANDRCLDRAASSRSSRCLVLFLFYLFYPQLTFSSSSPLASSIPTVGFNMKRVQRGHVTLKCWDLGGQPRFRTMWERYCRGVNAIVFIVDIADMDLLPVARDELHLLMSQPTLDGIPLLVLGNKSDLPHRISVDELIDALDLKDIANREVSCYGISAKEETNLEAVVQWLMKFAGR